ncbi:alpha/beta fold hydrolase [Solirubrobacter soli]|uniref:alpha/beta fold hydrolase n=1 Tax=Solirubrobacter soli TaxID=363832 RepID=UPI000427D6B4|nr:alpha/beta fold hydrolase [Solirubrobacter soli]
MSSLHFHRWGPEPARVLLIHGITSSGATMWQLGEALAERGALAPDLLGHGESPDSDRYTFADLAAGLGTGYELVVGHSLGGAVAAHAAAHDPGFARRLILLDPALDLREDPSIRAAIIDEATNPASEAEVRAANPGWDAQTVRTKALASRQARPEAMGRIIDDNAPWHHAHLLDRVTVPTLILGAGLDPVAMPALADGRPHVEYRVVEGAGHSVHRDRPDVVLQAI